MDLKFVRNGFDLTRKKKNWVVLLAALGVSGYGVYRVYNLPSVVHKRKRVFKLLGALISITEAISDSAEAMGVVLKDLNEFLQSDSDQIPNSLKQVSKVTRSEEFSGSVSRVTEALVVGVLRGYQSKLRSADDEISEGSTFVDRVMDKILTGAGSGFASVVVGSFARNLVMAFYLDEQQSGGVSNLRNSTADDNLIPKWVNVVCSDKCKELIGDCIQLFVSTMVTVYLDKTMGINTYDEFFSGLTNPKHETKMRDMLVSVCNGSIETLVKTSHHVLNSSNTNGVLNSDSSSLAFGQEASLTRLKDFNAFDKPRDGGWVDQVSLTLAVPSNRRFVLDLTGQVTVATVRSFLEFLMEKLCNGMRKCVYAVHDGLVDTGLEVVRYVGAKSSVIVTICLSLCLHVFDGSSMLVHA